METKLRHLAKLEEMKIKVEQNDLAKEQEELQKILQSDTKLKNLVKKEIQADKELYGDERRSPIVSRVPAQALREEEIITAEPITVVLSQQGWIPRGERP